MMSILLRSAVNVSMEADDQEFRTAAEAIAFVRDHPDRLLQQCPNLGFTPLHYACDSPLSPRVIKILVDACPEALEVPCFFGFTPLDLALKNVGDALAEEGNSADTIRLLLDRYAGTSLTVKPGYVNCSLGPKLVSTLAASTKLQSLDLSRVSMTSKGLVAFLHRLGTNTAIEDLVLNFFEDVDEETCEALFSMMTTNTKLTRLTLRIRLFAEETRDMVESTLNKAMKMNDTLEQLLLEVVPHYKLRLLMNTFNTSRSICQVNRQKIDFFLRLNRLGRKQLASPDLTKADYGRILSGATSDLDETFVMVRMLPHMWLRN